jgi:hypothetical protein
MEYFINYTISKKYLQIYNNRKVIQCENEYIKYRCNKYYHEWFIDNKRHRRNAPATITYINNKIATVEYYTYGYRGNMVNDITVISYFENGDPMNINLKYSKDMPSTIEYYKNGNPHFISYDHGYDSSRSDGLEFIDFYRDGEIAHIGYANRLDYLLAVQVLYIPLHTVIYHYCPTHPKGLCCIKINGDTTIYQYMTYSETFINGKLQSINTNEIYMYNMYTLDDDDSEN